MDCLAYAKKEVKISDNFKWIVVSDSVENRINACLSSIHILSSQHIANKAWLDQVKQILSMSAELVKSERLSVVHVIIAVTQWNRNVVHTKIVALRKDLLSV